MVLPHYSVNWMLPSLVMLEPFGFTAFFAIAGYVD